MNTLIIIKDDFYTEYPINSSLEIKHFDFSWTDNSMNISYKNQEYQLQLNQTLIIDDYEFRIIVDDEKIYQYEWPLKINKHYGDIKLTDYNIFIDDFKLVTEDEVYVDGELVLESAHLDIGSIILVGCLKLVIKENKISVIGSKENYESDLLFVNHSIIPFEGFPNYYKSPRLIKKTSYDKITIKTPPSLVEVDKNGLLKMLLPPLSGIIVTVVAGIFMNRGPYVYIMLITTLVTTAISVTNFIENNRTVTEDNKNREKVYKDYLLEKRRELHKVKEAELASYQYHYPTTKSIVNMIDSYDSRIYEKDVNDDFLTIMIGVEDQTPDYQLEFNENEFDIKDDPLLDEARKVYKSFDYVEDKPHLINLNKAHVGLIGNKIHIHEQLKNIIAQLTFFQSYHDIELMMLYDKRYQEEFDYLKWYPHFKIKAVNATGNIFNEHIRDQVLGSLQQILRERKIQQREKRQDVKFLPHYVIIVDDFDLIMNHPVMEYLGEDGTELGFSLIFTAQLLSDLPDNIKTIISLEDANNARILINEGESQTISMKLNHVDNSNLEKSARQLFAIKHEQGVTARIPESIGFFEMYDVKHPKELDVISRWSSNKSYKSLAVPLGVRAEDDIVELNLHEKAHGPHGLVAGTTGSGKSEIVQSYILSLAVNFHPYEVGFLLIDYKGGGMASLFKDLPHLLGTITNLDGAESMRALASIKSELARRQELFNYYSVNHIDAYHKLRETDDEMEPLPHLFIISDEFAELKKEQPEFMSELVSAARIGRSLGIKLILATQKPSGVVDDQIWSNSKFKLALKVQDESDSKEVLKTTDAATITQPGRAYLQVGNNEIYELFQSAYSGALFSEDKVKQDIDNRVYYINEIRQPVILNEDLSYETAQHSLTTELDITVNEISHVYSQLDLEAVRKPWLPSLLSVITAPYLAEDLDRDLSKLQEIDLDIAIGIVDVPEQQLQKDYRLNFIHDGNLVIYASSGYGKSTTLATIILSLALQNNPKLVNFYLIDFGNSALMPFINLPHVADYMGFDDLEKLGKLIVLIEEEIKIRKSKLGLAMLQNIEVYNKVHPKDMIAPLFIILDNYDVIRELESVNLEDFITRVSRDGVSLGIYVIVTATREAAVRYGTASNFKNIIVQYLYDHTESMSILGRSEYIIPEIKGRSLVKLENINMMQVFAPVAFENDIEYAENLQNTIKSINNAYQGEKIHGIPILPDTFMFSDFESYESKDDQTKIGLTLDDVKLRGTEIKSPFIILGPVNSGKRNLMHIYLNSLSIKDSYLIDTEENEFEDYKGKINYASDEKSILEIFDLLNKEFLEKENQLEAQKLMGQASDKNQENSKISTRYIFIHDVDTFIENFGTNKLIQEVIMDSKKYNIKVVVTADNNGLKKYDDLTDWFKSSTHGVLLGEQRTRIYPEVGYNEEPTKGFGVIVEAGNTEMVMLPRFNKEGDM